MARYTPGNTPADQSSLSAFIRVELAKIAQALDTQDAVLSLKTLYAAPTKYGEGTLVKADGTTWNPGAGAGVYCFRGGAWTFLG